jgi:hypothetical protein
MREAVTEKMRMEVDAGSPRSSHNGLVHAVIGHGASMAQPELGSGGVSVLRPHPEVAVERECGLATEGHDSLAASLSENSGGVRFEFDVINQ